LAIQLARSGQAEMAYIGSWPHAQNSRLRLTGPGKRPSLLYTLEANRNEPENTCLPANA